MLGPQAWARCVAVLQSECIHRLDSRVQRGGLPHNLHSGDIATQGGAANAIERDGRGLEQVDKLASGLGKPLSALQGALDSAFLQARQVYLSVARMVRADCAPPCQHIPPGKSQHAATEQKLRPQRGTKGPKRAALPDARKPQQWGSISTPDDHRIWRAIEQ
jgi:hypothetical protein